MIKNLLHKICRKICTSIVKKRCKSYGENLKVNMFSKITKNTTLGNNVNFNGMRISGLGKVLIGDNFHSGTECMIITSITNIK